MILVLLATPTVDIFTFIPAIYLPPLIARAIVFIQIPLPKCPFNFPNLITYLGIILVVLQKSNELSHSVRFVPKVRSLVYLPKVVPLAGVLARNSKALPFDSPPTVTLFRLPNAGMVVARPIRPRAVGLYDIVLNPEHRLSLDKSLLKLTTLILRAMARIGESPMAGPNIPTVPFLAQTNTLPVLVSDNVKL